MFNIIIDGDGCPVIEETLQIAEHFSIPVTLISDTSHVFYYENCHIITTDQGKDSTDFVVLQNVNKNDIVITQDYGLAALVLSKKATAISQNGIRFQDSNILGLLNQRSDARKLRKHNKHFGHSKKRSRQDTIAFENALVQCILSNKEAMQ